MSGAFVLNGFLAGLLALVGIAGALVLAHVLIVRVAPDGDGSEVARRRRGVKALAIGKDGRASTSKVQALLWTGALFYAFTFLLLWGRSANCGDEEHRSGERCAEAGEAREAFGDAIDQGLQTEYYVLLGFPVGAALAAKALTSSKVAAGTMVKTSADESPERRDTGVAAGLAQLVSNDRGESDLLDFQYLVFNLLALAYFALEFVSTPGAGIPDLPPTLVALTGVGASAYTAKKALEHDLAPAVKSVIPGRIPLRVGAEFTVIGGGFRPPSTDNRGEGATVLVNDIPAEFVSDHSRGGATRLRLRLSQAIVDSVDPSERREVSETVSVVDEVGNTSQPVELVLLRDANAERAGTA